MPGPEHRPIRRSCEGPARAPRSRRRSRCRPLPGNRLRDRVRPPGLPANPPTAARPRPSGIPPVRAGCQHRGVPRARTVAVGRTSDLASRQPDRPAARSKEGRDVPQMCRAQSMGGARRRHVGGRAVHGGGAGGGGALATAVPGERRAGVPALPGAVGCWNAIAVQTARRANVFPIQGLIAVSAPQLAVYDAVTEIAGRYAPYHAFSPPPGTQVAGASVDASIAAAAHATLVAAYPAQAAGPTGLDAQYAGYIAALRADGRSGIDAGVAIGDASARDLLAFRAGDRDESITYVPPPLSPGSWTFAPAPSLQSAQTPWVATMRPFTLASRVAVPAGPAPTAVERPMGGGVQRDEGLRLGDEQRPHPAADRGRAVLERAGGQPVQPGVPGRRRGAWDGRRGHRPRARHGQRRRRGRRDRVLGLQVPLPVLATDHGDPQRRDRRQSGDASRIRHGRRCSPRRTTRSTPPRTAASRGRRRRCSRRWRTRTDPGSRSAGPPAGRSTTGPPCRGSGGSDDLQEQIVNARVWAGLHYRGSVRAGVQVGTDVARWTLGRFFAPAPARDCRRQDGHPNTGGRS